MTRRQFNTLALTVTAATAGLIALATFFPGARLWGFAHWFGPPLWSMAVCAVALVSVTAFTLRQLPDSTHTPPDKTRWSLYSVTALVILAALFSLFRTKMHLYGDGYTVLSILSEADPLIKAREIGEAVSHVWVKNLSGKTGVEGALFSYRVLSIFGGLIFALGVLLTAQKLFTDNLRRILFSAGLLTGGYMLLFFGYVENYSLFVPSVGFFVLVGLLAARTIISRWWLLLPLAAAIFFHILGVCLIPAAVYLLLAPGPVGSWVGRLAPRTISLLSPLLLLVAIVAVYWYRTQNVFMRYSLISPTGDHLTIDGYTLFSIAHILDFLNLLFLLAPFTGLLILLIVAIAPVREARTRPYIFLTIAALSTLGAAFIFDPKLGMPRDWDLFSFSAVPVVTLFYLLCLDNPGRHVNGRLFAVLGIALSLFALVPRVASTHSTEPMIRRYQSYLNLDPLRDRNGRLHLINHFKELGDSTRVHQLRAEWHEAFPLRDSLMKAWRYKKSGRTEAAIRLYEKIATEDPTYADAWSNLGEIYSALGRYDTALACLDMAVGLNPYDVSGYSNRGLCALAAGDFEAAERDFLTALDMYRDKPAVYSNLAWLYHRTGRRELAEDMIHRMEALPDLRVDARIGLFQWYAATGQTRLAIKNLRSAVALGADTTQIRQVINQFPEIKKALSNR